MTTLESDGSREIVGEVARQVAEAQLDLVRIRNLEPSAWSLYLPIQKQSLDYSELDENLAQLQRYERRGFSRRKRALFAMSEL